MNWFWDTDCSVTGFQTRSFGNPADHGPEGAVNWIISAGFLVFRPEPANLYIGKNAGCRQFGM
jgi:hypothetical protein